MIDIITILGPTASGKTTLAALLAYKLKSEIISADSRQVYKRMDIGTGKDLKEYVVNGIQIPYHLIDICEPGSKYNLFEFQKDFKVCYENIRQRNIVPVFCGGSGLYIESILKNYNLLAVPENKELRDRLADKSLEELETILRSYKEKLHNVTDIDTPKRAIRAIEIEEYYKSGEVLAEKGKEISLNSLTIGISIDREYRRKKITTRLSERLESGMIDEVKNLLESGINEEDLIYYGLEYKFITEYIIGRISYDEMLSKLEIAIHQFAKRQMTWFRGMERRGVVIHWIEGELPLDEKLEQIEQLIKKEQ